jgi:hypothetical protein
MGILSRVVASNPMDLAIVAAGLAVVTFFGKQFGQGATGLAQGISALLSPQITPKFVPEFGLKLSGIFGTSAEPSFGGGGGQSNGSGAGVSYNNVALQSNDVVTPGSRETSDIGGYSRNSAGTIVLKPGQAPPINQTYTF